MGQAAQHQCTGAVQPGLALPLFHRDKPVATSSRSRSFIMAIVNKRTAMLLSSSSLTRPLFLLGTGAALLSSGSAQAFDANSLPQGGTVTGGAATMATSGNTLTVNQSSNRAI